MNEHSLTKLLLVINMHLCTLTQKDYKILNFEQAHHFCSKQAVHPEAVVLDLFKENVTCYLVRFLVA